MQLSKKQRSVSQFFALLLKDTSGFEHFFLNATLIPYAFPKLRTVKNVVRKMSKKPRFRTQFNSQHAKQSQTLLKSSLQNFYHIFFIILIKTIMENVSVGNI